MIEAPRMISLGEWDARHADLAADGLKEAWYGGPISRHVDQGDTRLIKLRFDNSVAALGLWNFLLTEEERLLRAREEGYKLVGAMKDLGTVPVLAYSASRLRAFYPDGAWWIPCVMELNAGLLGIADSLGIDDSFCPVRAMLGAFVTEAHFPIPDLLTCSVGATCDDFSVIAQRLNGLGYPIHWWEIPARRRPDSGEAAVRLPGGFEAPREQVAMVRAELERLRPLFEDLSGERLDETACAAGIREANKVRRILRELRQLAYAAEPCPMPALELLIAEMLAIHFCSDRDESARVLAGLLNEVRRRVDRRLGVLPEGAARVFWVNPVADLHAMNLLEECGGRICGTDYLFCHAYDEIPEGMESMEALARMALADPMIGPAADRADRICRDIELFGAEAMIISRIPGASHCATEGVLISEAVRSRLDIPVIEVEVPPLIDPVEATVRTRMEALVEMVRERRKS